MFEKQKENQKANAAMEYVWIEKARSDFI